MVRVEESEIVKSVLNQLNSKHTKRNYITYLNRFVNDFLNNEFTIEELVAEARKDVTKTQKRLDDFYEWLQRVPNPPLRESAAYQAAYAPVRGFFANLNITFQRQWGKRHSRKEHVSEAIKQDSQYDFFPVDEGTRTIRFDRDLMQKFLHNLKLRDQAIALALLSSSQDSSDLFSLNIGDIQQQTNNRVFWEGRRGKTEITFRTFFSKEATKFVRRYIEQERRNATEDEPLFVYTSHKRPSLKLRMETRYLSQIYREAAKKLGITWKRRDQNPLRPKRMRHLFRTACDTVGVNELYINCFMGHKNHMGQKYSELPRARLELEYLRVEPFLTVYGEAEEKEEFRGEISKLKVTVETLTAKVEEQKRTINDLQEFMEKRVEEITTKLIEKRMEKILKERYEISSEQQKEE